MARQRARHDAKQTQPAKPSQPQPSPATPTLPCLTPVRIARLGFAIDSSELSFAVNSTKDGTDLRTLPGNIIPTLIALQATADRYLRPFHPVNLVPPHPAPSHSIPPFTPPVPTSSDPTSTDPPSQAKSTPPAPVPVHLNPSPIHPLSALLQYQPQPKPHPHRQAS